MRLIVAFILLISLSACNFDVPPRRKWQNPADFATRRNVEYNEFVGQGGLQSTPESKPGEKAEVDRIRKILSNDPQNTKLPSERITRF